MARNTVPAIFSRIAPLTTFPKSAGKKLSPCLKIHSFPRDFGHIGHITLPPPDLFLRGMLKEKVHKPRTVMQLKDNIWEKIDAVTPNMLVGIFCNMEKSVQV